MCVVFVTCKQCVQDEQAAVSVMWNDTWFTEMFTDWVNITFYTTCICNMYVNETLIKPGGCIVWNAHNTVFGSKRPAICALAVYFVHSTRPKIQALVSRDSIVDRQFVTAWVRQWVTNIRFMYRSVPSIVVAVNFGGDFLYGVCRPGEWFSIDSNCKNG